MMIIFITKKIMIKTLSGYPDINYDNGDNWQVTPTERAGLRARTARSHTGSLVMPIIMTIIMMI